MHEVFPSWPQYLSHRQLLAWEAWFAMEWNRPSRADHYVMQLNYDVRYLFSKSRPRTLDPIRLRFSPRESQPAPRTAEEATRRARSAIIAASGGKFRVRLPDGTLVDGKGVLP